MNDQDNKASLRTQLSELNERSRMYARNMWQLPFAYNGIVVVSMVSNMNPPIDLVLCAAGICVFLSMLGAYRAIGNIAENIEEIERKLGLIVSVKKHHQLIDIPYFFLLGLGIIASITFSGEHVSHM